MIMLSLDLGEFKEVSLCIKGQLDKVLCFVLKDEVHVDCPCCGHPMKNYGFTRYEKVPFGVDDDMQGKGADTPIQPFHPQRLICTNKDCPSQVYTRRGESHILLPDILIPKLSLYAKDADLIYEVREAVINFFAERRRKEGKPEGKVRLDINVLMEEIASSRDHPVFERLKKMFGDHVRYFLETYVLSPKGASIHRACRTLRSNILAIVRSVLAQGGNIPVSSKTSDMTVFGRIANIIKVHGSHFVRTFSTSPKYSIAYMANRMGP